MDSSQPRVASANLSRAYAALRRLDVLRAQDILQPVGEAAAVTRRDPAPALGPSTSPAAKIRAAPFAAPRTPASLNHTQAPLHTSRDATWASTTSIAASTVPSLPSTAAQTDSMPYEAARTLPSVAPPAIPPRFQPLSPTPGGSLLDETSRLTHPTTLASSSRLSAGTPYVASLDAASARPVHQYHEHPAPLAPRPSPSAARPSSHLARPHATQTSTERSFGGVGTTSLSSFSPSPHTDIAHRYRPRRGLASTAGEAVPSPRAPASATGSHTHSVTPRDRVGDYRGEHWEDAELPPPLPTTATDAATATTATTTPAPPAPAPSEDTFFDVDPALQVAAAAMTHRGFTPLSIARESTERPVAEDTEHGGGARGPSSPSQWLRAPLATPPKPTRGPTTAPPPAPPAAARSRSPLVSTQDHRGPARATAHAPPAPQSPTPSDTMSCESSPDSSYGTSGSVDSRDEAAVVTPLPYVQPFVSLKRPESAPTTTSPVSASTAARAARLVETYRARLEQVRARVAQQTQSRTSTTRTSSSAGTSLDAGDVTRAGETAVAAPRSTSSASSASSASSHSSSSPLPPRRAPSVVSYRDYLVTSPHPRSTTASHSPAAVDGAQGVAPDAPHPDRSRATATWHASSERDSPPRLTASGVARGSRPDVCVAVVPCGEAQEVVEPAADDTDNLVAFVEAIHLADAETLSHALEAMIQREERDTDSASSQLFTEDCLGVTVVLNKSLVVEELVVPWLVEELMQLHGARSGSAAGTEGHAAQEPDHQAGPRDPHRRDCALLCALAGLGPRAYAAWPALCTLLSDLAEVAAPQTNSEDGDALALVLLAMRTVGGDDALMYLRDLLASPEQPTPLRTAAAYGLGLLSRDVAGHTTVLGLPLAVQPPSSPLVLYASSAEVRGSQREGRNVLPTFLSHPPPTRADAEAQPTASAARTANAQRGRAAMRAEDAAAALAAPAPSVLVAVPPLLRPPPYVPTNIVVDVRHARTQLLAFVASHSTAFAKPDSGTELGTVLRDFVDAPADALVAASVRPSVGDTSAVPTEASAQTRVDAMTCGLELARAGLSEVLATVEASWREPVLPCAYTHALASQSGLVFEVERALLHAAVGSAGMSSQRPPSSAHRRETDPQESALLALASLPAHVRLHVAQPLLEYVEHIAATSPSLAGTALPITSCELYTRGTEADMRTASAAPGPSTAVSEAVFTAAAVALGCVMSPLAASPAHIPRAASLLCTLVRQAPPACVRHGALAGLGFLLLSWRTDVQPQADDSHGEDEAFRRVVPVVLRLCTVCLLDGSAPPQTAAWVSACAGPAGARHLLGLLRTTAASTYSRAHTRVVAKEGERAVPRLSTHAQLACVQALLTVPFDCPSTLLDELIDTFGTLAISQGLVEEEVQRACVRVLARTLYASAPCPSPTTTDCAPERDRSNHNDWPVVAQTDGAVPVTACTEVFEYYAQEAPTETFKVLRSVLESSTMAYGVLCEVFRCLCLYGGAHGELYTCQTCMESTITAARGAAAYGLRGAGARAVRVLALALNDEQQEVRREAEATVAFIGVASFVDVLAQRPAEHRVQVTMALRDCLLRDLGRQHTHVILEDLYNALTEDRCVPRTR